MKGSRVRINVGAVGIQVDAEGDQPGERLGPAVEGGEDQTDLLVPGTCRLRETRDLGPTSKTKRGRQSQLGPPVDEVFSSSEVAVYEGIMRVEIESSAGVDQYVNKLDLYPALTRDP